MYKGEVFGVRPLRDSMKTVLSAFLAGDAWRDSGIAASVLRIVLLVECRVQSVSGRVG